MSVLVDPNAFPHAIRAVYDWAPQTVPPTGLAEQEFADFLTPQDSNNLLDTYRDGRDVLRSALREAVNLGLLKVVDGEYMAEPIKPHALLQAIRQGIFQREQAFTDALTWLMSQDPYRASQLSNWEDYQLRAPELQKYVSNDVQFSNFQRWAIFLKLAQMLNGQLRPNPSAAVAEVYANLTQPADKEWTAEVFCQAIREQLPILPAPVGGVLSGAFSFALISLEKRKAVAFHADSDAKKLTLTLPQSSVRDFSRVRILRSKA